MAVLQRPRAMVERDGENFVVVLIKPDGERNYYVSTAVDSDGAVYPFVSGTTDKAKKFGLETSAKGVAGDMTSFLNREYANLVKWH
jgi:hypothetical protein